MRGVFTVAKVAVSAASYSFDRLYSYHVPEDMEGQVLAGMRVLIPFGRGNRKVIGFIASTYQESVYNDAIKPIISVVDSQSLVTEEMMRIILWLKEHTFCTYFEAYRSCVPNGFSLSVSTHYELVNTYIDEDSLDESEKELIDFLRNTKSQRDIDSHLGDKSNKQLQKTVQSLIDKGYIETGDLFKRKVGDETVKMVRLTDEYLNGDFSSELTPKQKNAAEMLSECECASVKELCYMTGCTAGIIKALVDKGAAYTFDYEVMRDALGEIGERVDPESVILNDEQQQAFEGIISLVNDDKPSGALLYGVTGSGKTSVFIRLINEVIKGGKTAMLLVPEISLTPQMLTKFKSLFGEKIAVLHSSLSMGQRIDEFKRIRNGDARIVIGTRSAVFAPLSDIGISIMDEEGEPSYKSDQSPRYHARDVAVQRCGYHNAVLLLASATPSLETFNDAKKGRFHLFELHKRYNDAKLPDVSIIDMQQEAEEGNSGLFSRELADGIQTALDRNEQVILFLNRRGHSTHATCLDCRQPISCPNCRLPLTYHKKNNRFMCHYCGYTMDNLEKCPVCKGDKIRLTGVGTQKVEDELARLFPRARLLRMDADTTRKKGSHEDIINRFKNHEYDILLGTQMISKGLDFPLVTLVGVINADATLNIPDFRSGERTFSLLNQVAGRAGRSEIPGEVIIQTFNPDNFTLSCVKENDYLKFYKYEMENRHKLDYPPYYYLTSIKIASKDYEIASKEITKVKNYLLKNLSNSTIILGPTTANVFKMNNIYRFQIILKYKKDDKLFTVLKELDKLYALNNKANIEIDNNPLSV